MEENIKLTTEEAMRLIGLLKYKIEKPTIQFPHLGEKLQFEALSSTSSDKFTVNITRSSHNKAKCTYQGRTSNNIPIMRLDVGTNITHINSDGTKIIGNHLHIYDAETDMLDAIEFNTCSPDLYKNCIEFFKKFNLIVDEDDIIYQEELF